MPVPGEAFKRRVRMHSELLTVHRRDDTTSASYGESLSYTELGDRNICMAGLEESVQQTPSGERQAQRVAAYTTADVDLQPNDRIDYGSETYEVLTDEGKPTETDPAIYRYELDNV